MTAVTPTDPVAPDAPIDIREDGDGAGPPSRAAGPAGFLPVQTNGSDRLFIAVVIWVALSLAWFRLVEPLGPSIWISNLLGLVLAVIIVRKG